jgi:hypothetical protein
LSHGGANGRSRFPDRDDEQGGCLIANRRLLDELTHGQTARAIGPCRLVRRNLMEDGPFGGCRTSRRRFQSALTAGRLSRSVCRGLHRATTALAERAGGERATPAGRRQKHRYHQGRRQSPQRKHASLLQKAYFRPGRGANSLGHSTTTPPNRRPREIYKTTPSEHRPAISPFVIPSSFDTGHSSFQAASLPTPLHPGAAPPCR